MTLLAAEVVPLDWVAYCALTSDKQLVWEERGDELNKAILYLLNLKNEHARKDLHLAYSQGNMTAYSPTIKAITRYLSTQYPNNKPNNQRNGEKGDTIKEIIRNPKTRIVAQVTLQVHTLKILQQLNISPLLAEGPVSALMFWRQVYRCPVHHALWRRF